MAEHLPSDNFHRAWLAPRLRLLGHDCAPFCLGHRILLTALRSPFVLGGDKSPGDVLLLLRVCSRAQWPFDSFDPGTPTDAEVAALSEGDAFEDALVAIYAWLDECCAAPELWASEEDDRRTLTAPYGLALALRLIRNGISEPRAFTMPEGVARWYACALSEMEGGDAFVTDADAQLMASIETAGGRN